MIVRSVEAGRICQSLFLGGDHEPSNPNRGFI
jgi:hypothetical protein